MQRPLPVWIDLTRAPAQQTLKSLVPAERLPRLLDAGIDLLRPADVQLQIQVPEFRSDARPAFVTGRIVASVAVQCQRCMEPIEQGMDVQVHWHLLESDSKEDEDDFEPILLDGDRFHVMEAVADELLLAVPSYPTHDSCMPPGVSIDSDDT